MADMHEKMSFSTSSRVLLLSILSIIFTFSIFFSFYYRISPTTDAKAYNKIAQNLALGKGYIEKKAYVEEPKLDDAIVRVGPGYEFFLAGVYRYLAFEIELVWLFQAVLRVLTAYIIYKLSLIIFIERRVGEAVGLFAAFIFGMAPDLIIMNGMLLAETLYLFLLTLGIYLSIIVIEKTSFPILLVCSFIWGLAALVRPTAIPMFLLLTIFLIYKRRLKHGLFILLFPVIILGAWSLRNSLLYERPLFTTTAGSYALWVGNNLQATGGYDKPPEIQKVIEGGHSVDVVRIANRQYFTFILKYPFRFAELQFRKTIIYFSLIRPTGFWYYLQEKPLHRVFTLFSSTGYTALLFVLGLAGHVFYYKRYVVRNYLFLSFAIFQPLLVVPMYVETRYRYPFFIFLAIFSAYTIYLYIQDVKIRKILIATALILTVVTVIDMVYSYDTILHRFDFIRKEFVDEREL